MANPKARLTLMEDQFSPDYTQENSIDKEKSSKGSSGGNTTPKPVTGPVTGVIDKLKLDQLMQGF